MSFEPGQEEEFGAVCPYLGLADDADSHATYPTDAHRCYRLPNPTRIATHHQETYCLVANHTGCPVYLGNEVPGVPRQPPAQAQPAASAGAFAGTEAAARPRPSGFAGSPRPRRTPAAGTLTPRPRAGGISMPVATIGLFALAVVVIAIAFGITQLTGKSSNNTGLNLPGFTATATSASGAGTASATTTAVASQTAAGSTTPAASPTSSGGAGTYTVQSGDTCYGIATSHGVTLDQLEAANGGANGACANLNPGDVLTIP